MVERIRTTEFLTSEWSDHQRFSVCQNQNLLQEEVGRPSIDESRSAAAAATIRRATHESMYRVLYMFTQRAPCSTGHMTRPRDAVDTSPPAADLCYKSYNVILSAAAPSRTAWWDVRLTSITPVIRDLSLRRSNIKNLQSRSHWGIQHTAAANVE